ncbi:hypothetical protein JXX30_15815 [Rhodococcus erythropolis]|uniref:hypothetical protein n=1 Tax=Rhodococcus erythropolis TaxID=1833 RepID=UPI00197F11B0|nr:hypothetical protein [Rhodococcus erythropolis]QSE38883.1 hypothetical protein JXX30_15815 [Rhodococcus erythropolis]
MPIQSSTPENAQPGPDAPVRAKFTPRHGAVSIGRRSGPSVVIPDVADVHSLIDDLQTAVREMARHQEAEAARSRLEQAKAAAEATK